MRRLLLAVLLLGPPPAARALFRESDAGTASAQFLRLGADARAMGMGEAARAVAEDATATYWNPAGLASLRTRHVSFSHAALYQGVFHDFAAFAMPIPSRVGGRRERELRSNQLGSIGVAVLYLNAGKIGEVDNTATATGDSFTPQDAAFLAAWGLPLNRWLDLGLGAKLVHSRIKGSASTGAFDIGTRARLRLGELPWTVAFGAYNLGGSLRFIKEDSPLPFSFTLGNSFRPLKNLIVAVDLTAPRDSRIYPSFGGEYRAALDQALSAALRLGWQGRTSSGNLDGFTGITAGGGISYNRLTFDYGWAPFGALGEAHRIGLSIRF